MRVMKLLAAVGLALGVAVPAFGQVDVAAAQKKLLAKRSAEADAYRKLAETIRGLQINSETHVRDFVTESDQIRAGLDAFIRGVRLGQPRWFDDLSCEVPAEVTVAKVVETLKEIHERHYKGSKIKSKDFEEITRHVEKSVIRVVGMGAPREDLPPDLPEGVVEQLGGPPIPAEPPVPDLWRQIGPRGRLMAIRAAHVDAMRKMLERIVGLRINSETQVRDFVAESDTIHTVASGTLLGATEISTYLHADEPIAEVTVEVPVESVISFIRELSSKSIQGDRIKGSDITEITRSISTQKFQATGMGIPPPDVMRRFNTLVKDPADRLPPWAAQPIRATGNGVAPAEKAGTPQGKLLAARAAELDAKRQLAEQVSGLRIGSSTTVKDFITQHDEIRAQVDAVLLGAAVEKTSFDGDTASVVVVLPGMAVWDVVHDPLASAPPAGAGAPPGANTPTPEDLNEAGLGATPPPPPPPPPPGEQSDDNR